MVMRSIVEYFCFTSHTVKTQLRTSNESIKQSIFFYKKKDSFDDFNEFKGDLPLSAKLTYFLNRITFINRTLEWIGIFLRIYTN